jgi:hypothetical protein
MRLFLCGAVLLLISASAGQAEEAKPATQPAADTFVQPQARRAQEVMQARMAQLDAEYAVKKADVLQRYADSLNEAQLAALRSGDREEAQKIYEAAQRVLILFQQLSPGTKDPPAGKPLTPYQIKIRDFNGAAGVTEIVEVSTDSISVIGEDDFGHPPRVLWKGDLRPPQKRRMSAFMSAFPLESLHDNYADLNVNDGYQVDFTIQIGNGAARKISVANRHQISLEHLVDQVNTLLPPKYALSRMSGG